MSGSTAISAHRGGSEFAKADSYEAYRGALEAGAEYVEFDVRRTADGTLVACHAARVRGRAVTALSYPQLCRLAGYPVPQLTEVLSMMAGRATAHLDIKEPDRAEEIVTAGAGVLGPAGLLVTMEAGSQAAALKRRFPTVPVGISIGGDLRQAARFAARRVRDPGYSRLDPVLTAGADWAVVYWRLARTGVLAECRRWRIKTAVWTVNADQELAQWLASPDVDLLITDRPARAIALRARTGIGGPGSPGTLGLR